jgi:hypothetical protein
MKDRSRLFRTIISPAGITLLVGLLYLAAVILHAGGNPLELARLGTRYSDGASTGIYGYDGQFVYYIARDPNPEAVTPHLDVPAYRYQRILLPLLARVISLGNLALIPWLLPALNLLVHTLAVALLTRLFVTWGRSPWHALVYGLWVGLLYALRLDLPEPLAFGLVIAAVYFQQRQKRWLAWLCYALSLFAKETILFFLLAQLLVYLARRQWRAAASFGLVTLFPFGLFQLWLWRVFGQMGFGSGGIWATPLAIIPFNGIWRIAQDSFTLMLGFIFMYLPIFILPSLWGLWVAAQRWLTSDPEFTAAALFANAAIIPFMPFSLYREPVGAFRLATGLLLALLLFAARHDLRRPLNYAYLYPLLNLMLLPELLQPF